MAGRQRVRRDRGHRADEPPGQPDLRDHLGQPEHVPAGARRCPLGGPGAPVLRQTADITWLPPTAQNLARLTVPIPAGFRQVPLAEAVRPILRRSRAGRSRSALPASARSALAIFACSCRTGAGRSPGDLGRSRLCDCEEYEMNDDQRLAANEPGRRDTTTTYRRPAGSRSSSRRPPSGWPHAAAGPAPRRSPAWAEQRRSSGDSASRRQWRRELRGRGSRGNPTQLLDEWATCMRGHGDPSQADPTDRLRTVTSRSP